MISAREMPGGGAFPVEGPPSAKVLRPDLPGESMPEGQPRGQLGGGEAGGREGVVKKG